MASSSTKKTFSLGGEEVGGLVTSVIAAATSVGEFSREAMSLMLSTSSLLVTLIGAKVEALRRQNDFMDRVAKAVDGIHEEFEHIGSAAQAMTLRMENELAFLHKHKARLFKVMEKEFFSKEMRLSRGQHPGRNEKTRPLAKGSEPLTHRLDPTKLSHVEAPSQAQEEQQPSAQ